MHTPKNALFFTHLPLHTPRSSATLTWDPSPKAARSTPSLQKGAIEKNTARCTCSGFASALARTFPSCCCAGEVVRLRIRTRTQSKKEKKKQESPPFASPRTIHGLREAARALIERYSLPPSAPDLLHFDLLDLLVKCCRFLSLFRPDVESAPFVIDDLHDMACPIDHGAVRSNNKVSQTRLRRGKGGVEEAACCHHPCPPPLPPALSEKDQRQALPTIY